MDRVMTVALQHEVKEPLHRLAQIFYLSDKQRPDRSSLRHEAHLPSGDTLLIESECVDATGMLGVVVQHRGDEVLRTYCRWAAQDFPFLRVRLHGTGFLTLQFTHGLLRDGGPVVR